MKVARGFTLIELLVVIAIIGILSSVVLASLSSARTKGADAAIKSAMSSLRSQIELDYDSVGVYGSGDFGGCPAAIGHSSCSNPTVLCQPKELAIFKDISEKSGVGISSNGLLNSYCWSDGSNYTIEVQLKTSATSWFCIDSTGNTKTMGSPKLSGSAKVCL